MVDIPTIDQLKSLVTKKDGFGRSNLFRVILPSGIGAATQELNLLCSNVNLPGRQIFTRERLIGVKGRKMPYGFGSDDVSMTFYCLNDYGTRRYIEAWQNLVLNQETYEIGYPSDYARDITIDQLSKNATQKLTFEMPAVDNLLSNIIPGLNIDIDLTVSTNISYKCILMDAFPTTMNVIELNNELDGLVQLNVQFSYRNWRSI